MSTLWKLWLGWPGTLLLAIPVHLVVSGVIPLCRRDTVLALLGGA